MAPCDPPGAGATPGRTGEAAAERYLRRSRFVILDRNWRSGQLELDIVARDGATVVFVEVKARRPGPQPAAEAVTPRKRRNLRRAARDWIHAHPHTGGEYRFDVVAVTLRSGRQPLIRHIRDAFTGDDV